MGSDEIGNPDVEYERRFLVADTAPLLGARGDLIEQGYLWVREGYAVRVRLVRDPEDESPGSAWFTLKGPREHGSVGRLEVESEVPIAEGLRLFELCAFRVRKVRYPVISEDEIWVVDAFEGQNTGLAIAEIEGSRAAVESVKKPWWCGREITHDVRYANENLAREPWGTWTDDARRDSD